MQIISDDGENVLEQWLKCKTLLRVEVVGAPISLSFTGILVRFSLTEIVVARNADELSISTFCGACRMFCPTEQQVSESFWQQYRRVVQVTTDGGAQCHIYALRELPEV